MTLKTNVRHSLAMWLKCKGETLLKEVAHLYLCLQFLEHMIIAVTNVLLLAMVNYSHVGLSSPFIDTSSPWLNDMMTNKRLFLIYFCSLQGTRGQTIGQCHWGSHVTTKCGICCNKTQMLSPKSLIFGSLVVVDNPPPPQKKNPTIAITCRTIVVVLDHDCNKNMQKYSVL